MPVVECDICSGQQVDNGDPTEILGLTIASAFYAGTTAGGPVPRNTFICIDCINGTAKHGPALLGVLVTLVFHEPQSDDPISTSAYAR